MSRRVAVTGGGGLIGGAVIDRLLSEGASVAALARNPARFERWTGCLDLVKGDLADEASLAALAAGAEAFVHCAGVTHARQDGEYQATNVDGARAAAHAAARAGARLVHLSSMSARLPSASPYALSKRDSETAVAAAHDAAVILRLPAIYGPGDMATLPYFKMVLSGLAAEPATTPEARASLLHVEDAAAAIIASFGAAGGVYEVGDDAPDGRSWREIGETLAGVLKVKARRLRAPRPLLEIVHGSARLGAALAGRAPAFRTGQLNEFFHPDWVARDNLLSEAIAWRAKVPLEEGFAKTARWYQKTGLL